METGQATTSRKATAPTHKSLWGDWIKCELKVIHELQKEHDDHDPESRSFSGKIASSYLGPFISSSRFQDISILIWLFFFISVTEFGFPYFWICAGNVLATYLLNLSFASARPIDDRDRDQDEGIEEPTSVHWTFRNDPDTYGFPSIESHMAIVVLGPALAQATIGLQLLGSVFIVLVGATRVFSGVRFAYQIVLSWGTGCVGLFLGRTVHLLVQPVRLGRFFQYVCVV